jgi:hypothetical protein
VIDSTRDAPPRDFGAERRISPGPKRAVKLKLPSQSKTNVRCGSAAAAAPDEASPAAAAIAPVGRPTAAAGSSRANASTPPSPYDKRKRSPRNS